MARFRLEKTNRASIYDQVRDQLLVGVETGERPPGSRLPSVRQFARLHGVNPKTVHRVYGRLQGEGLVDVRPGSGAYVRRIDRPTLDSERLLGLHRFFQSSVSECGRLGYEPRNALRLFASFVSRDRLQGACIGVLEEAPECAGWIAREIRTALDVQVVPLPISFLAQRIPTSGPTPTCLVTTDPDLHRMLTTELGRPVYRLAIDPGFARSLRAVTTARRLRLVVRQTKGLEIFLASEAVGLDDETRIRVAIVDRREHDRVPPASPQDEVLCISPLIGAAVAARIREGRSAWRLPPLLSRSSLDLVEAAVLFREAPTRGGGAPVSAAELGS